MAAILDLPFSMSLLIHAIEKEKEQAIWEMWLALYPNMGKENFISFSKFKAEAMKPQQQASDISSGEVKEEIMAIVKAYKGR